MVRRLGPATNEGIREKRLKPIYFVVANAVMQDEYRAMREGIDKVLEIAGVSDELEVRDYGYWHQGDGDFESADWYIEKSLSQKDVGFGPQVSGDQLLNIVAFEPWKKKSPHYDVFGVGNDLGYGQLNFVVGLQSGHNALVSPVRFRGLKQDVKRDCVMVETMHEVGHMFHAARGREGRDILGHESDSRTLYGNHCASDGCIMRQGNQVPMAWIVAAQDMNERGSPFCHECVADMKDYFNPSFVDEPDLYLID